MLPDIVSLKSEVSTMLQLFLKQRLNAYLGVINKAPRYIVKEGDTILTIRADGSEEESTLKRVESETSVEFGEVATLNPIERLRRLDRAAQDMANQLSEHFFKKIGDTLEKVGNVVESGGRPLSPDILLELLEKIEVEFEDNGEPSELTIVIPPHLREQAESTLRGMQEDPAYARRHEEIIERKREEWRDREASRRLVG